VTSKPHSAPEEPTTPSTADLASTAPMTPKSAAFSATERRPIDPTLSPDDPGETAAGKARGERPASSADRVLASEAVFGTVKLSVNPDCDGKSNFIAAARRAAQAAGTSPPRTTRRPSAELPLPPTGREATSADSARWSEERLPF